MGTCSASAAFAFSGTPLLKPLAVDPVSGLAFAGSPAACGVLRFRLGSLAVPDAVAYAPPFATSACASFAAAAGAVSLTTRTFFAGYSALSGAAGAAGVAGWPIDSSGAWAASTSVRLNATNNEVAITLLLSDGAFVYALTSTGLLVKFTSGNLTRLAQLDLSPQLGALAPGASALTAAVAGAGAIDAASGQAFFLSANSSALCGVVRVDLASMTVAAAATLAASRRAPTTAFFDATRAALVVHLATCPSQLVWVSKATLAELGALSLPAVCGSLPLVLGGPQGGAGAPAPGAVSPSGLSYFLASGPNPAGANPTLVTIDVAGMAQVGAPWVGITNRRGVTTYAASGGFADPAAGVFSFATNQGGAMALFSVQVAGLGARALPLDSASPGALLNTGTVVATLPSLGGRAAFYNFQSPTGSMLRLQQSAARAINVTGSLAITATTAAPTFNSYMYNLQGQPSFGYDSTQGLFFFYVPTLSPTSIKIYPLLGLGGQSPAALSVGTPTATAPTYASYSYAYSFSVTSTSYAWVVTAASYLTFLSRFNLAAGASYGAFAADTSYTGTSFDGGSYGVCATYNTRCGKLFPYGTEYFTTTLESGAFVYFTTWVDGRYSGPARIVKYNMASFAYQAQIHMLPAGAAPYRTHVWGGYVDAARGLALYISGQKSYSSGGGGTGPNSLNVFSVQYWLDVVTLSSFTISTPVLLNNIQGANGAAANVPGTNLFVFSGYATQLGLAVVDTTNLLYPANYMIFPLAGAGLPGDVYGVLPDVYASSQLGVFALLNLPTSGYAMGPATALAWLSLAPCAAGTAPAVGSTNASQCLFCPAGSAAPAGASACRACSAGTFAASSGAASCSQCAAGFYSTDIGATSCLPCGPGT